ncbi:5-formyltetrahydrofolate cyclo-ligase [Psychrobacter lutiphocae]|uniref:5-formyltetrahydrofolate cyclo-ligase n=1 Tax=Psychrobacter lutiphocae TaxID=540500 RepID=UPI0003800F07|nr:5-formyltetrahydrofolate cyclo-ligase [Psychrobacter lutiphocae]
MKNNIPSGSPSRQDISRQRLALTTQQRRTASALASRFLPKLTPRLPKGAKVGIYIDAFGELPTQPILSWCQRMGYSAYIPVVNSLGKDNKHIRFTPVFHSKLINIPTLRHNFGMRESKQRHYLWADELDLILCPLVAADEQGNRMGMGGGFYDTTLARSYQYSSSQFLRRHPLRVGWCYEFQVVEQLDTQPWDVPLNALITPEKIRWFS